MNSEQAGLEKVTLKNLMPDINNALIVGIIIAKQRPRTFISNGGNEESKERGVWNFTLRDSPFDYINVTCWGSAVLILELYDRFQTGDIVEVVKPRIEIRKVNDYGEQFRPMVTSPYSLTYNENHTTIMRHEGNDCQNFKMLLHLPTKPIANVISISNIHSRGSSINGELVDILGVVRLVNSTRDVTTRSGKPQQVREVSILDTTHPNLYVTIWDPELIARASLWKPQVTVLFMTDMKVEWSVYRRKNMVSMSNRSVIIENPAISETAQLRAFAVTAPILPTDILDQLASNINDLNSIQTAMSVRQILSKVADLEELENGRPEKQQFTALLYALVTELDLDGLSRVTKTRCMGCKSMIQSIVGICPNLDCPAGTTTEQIETETSFDLRVTLTDKTGSLVNCRMSGHRAEVGLKCTVQEFLAMSDEKKGNLKWNFLMEHCAVRIIVYCTGRRDPLISILGFELAPADERANKIPFF